MIIWRLKDPFNFRYAQAGLRGTWHPSDKSDEVCPECTSSCQKRIRPLVIEWKPDSNIIGDFIWPGLDSVAITENTLLGIQEHFRGFEPGPIEMVQDAKLKKPSKITKHYEPRVWLPYEGPSLFDLWVTSWVHLNIEKSTTQLNKKCGTCGMEYYEVYGVEREDATWNVKRGELVKKRVPRSLGQGIYVSKGDLKGADIFRVHEFPAWIFCTNRVKGFIEREGFTNVVFFEMGELT